MSKTLLQNLPITKRFFAVGNYCGATSTEVFVTTWGMILEAKFSNFSDELPIFEVFLYRLDDQSFAVYDARIYFGTPGRTVVISNFLYPKEVLEDLGLKFYGRKIKNYWTIRTPADMETFLKKHAHLSKLNQRPNLFEKLLQL